MQQLRVLIVDDMFAGAYALRRLIETMRPGAEVQTANGRDQAMEVLQTFEPDLVFLDVFLGAGLNLGGSDEIAEAPQLQAAITYRMSSDPYEARPRLTERTTRNGLIDKLELADRLGGILDELEGRRNGSAEARTA